MGGIGSGRGKPGVGGPGRPKGRKNNATLEREREVSEALGREAGTLKAKDVLSRAMIYFVKRWDEEEAKALQAVGKARDKLMTAVEKYVKLAASTASDLAPYQHPKLAMTTIREADPFEQMTDDELEAEVRRRAASLGVALPFDDGERPDRMN